MDDHGSGTEETRRGEQLYCSHPVLLLTLLYLLWLLVGVDVEGQGVPVGVLPDPLQPPSRHGPDAVRGDPDLEERAFLRPPPERVHPLQKSLRLLIPETGDAAPGVGDREEHVTDAHLFGGFRDGFRERVRVFVRLPNWPMVDVVELGDARVAGREHLAITLLAHLPDGGRVEALCQGVHPLPPGPEVVVRVIGVGALDAPPQPALEGVAVGVHKARRQDPAREPLTVARGPDVGYTPVFDGDANAAGGPASVEEKVGYESAPHPSSIGIWIPNLRAASRAAS